MSPLLFIALAQSTPIQLPEPVKFSIEHVEEGKPQFIFIFNLDEGTKKIVLPPIYHRVDPSKPEKPKEEPQIIRIFNLDEGTNEIVLPPAP